MRNIYFYATADRRQALFTAARGPSDAAAKFRKAGLLGARDRTVVPVSKALHEFLNRRNGGDMTPIAAETMPDLTASQPEFQPQDIGAPHAPADDDLAIPQNMSFGTFFTNDYPHDEEERGSGWAFLGGFLMGVFCSAFFGTLLILFAKSRGWL